MIVAASRKKQNADHKKAYNKKIFSDIEKHSATPVSGNEPTKNWFKLSSIAFVEDSDVVGVGVGVFAYIIWSSTLIKKINKKIIITRTRKK